MRTRLLICAVLFASMMGAKARPRRLVDWPAWRGADRTARCAETGLLTSWPGDGPALLWKTTGLGQGLSTPSVSGKLIFSMGNKDGREWVQALDRTAEGRQVWATPIGPIRHAGSGYPGPRSTPTVAGDRVYALGLNGDLVCLDTQTGNEVWKRDLVGQFGGGIPGWGYSESVLIDGGRVLCTPGGSQATLLALDKLSGQPIWQAAVGDTAGYSSIVAAKLDGVKQYVQFTMQGVLGIAAKDGKLLWRYDRPASGTANITTPITAGNTVFATAGYGRGSGLVRVKRDGSQFDAKEIYFTSDLKNRTGGTVLVDGYLYGSDDGGFLVCLEHKTGHVMWRTRDLGVCSLLFADGMFFARSEDGRISLLKATPEQFELLGQFDQPDYSGTTAYPHPVIADGRLYIRDQDLLLCYLVRGDGS